MLTKWSSSTNNVNRLIPIKLSSIHRIVVMVRFVYRFALHNLFSSKVWTIGLWLLFIRPCFGLIGTTSIRPWLKRRLLGLHPVLCFRRVYLGVFFLFGSNSRTIHLCIQGIYPSMFVCPSWIILDKCIKEWRILIQLCTYLKIHHIYIYLKIQTNPNLCKYSSIGMAHAQEPVP